MNPLPVMLHYTPFLYPLPIWDYWYLLVIPLCAAVSLVYKAVKCQSMRDVPRAALSITFWILLGLVVTAVGLMALVKFLER